MARQINGSEATQSIPEQLADQGLRRARADEAGWCAIVLNEQDEAIRVWATDLPASPTDEKS